MYLILLQNKSCEIKGRQRMKIALKEFVTFYHLCGKPVLSTKNADLPIYWINCNHAFEIVDTDFCSPIYL